jgi:hypothetical protein
MDAADRRWSWCAYADIRRTLSDPSAVRSSATAGHRVNPGWLSEGEETSAAIKRVCAIRTRLGWRKAAIVDRVTRLIGTGWSDESTIMKSEL